jgi:hypothetical protein
VILGIGCGFQFKNLDQERQVCVIHVIGIGKEGNRFIIPVMTVYSRSLLNVRYQLWHDRETLPSHLTETCEKTMRLEIISHFLLVEIQLNENTERPFAVRFVRSGP